MARESSQGRNIKLVLEYDGTDFRGWQVQPTGRTVQGELERALHQLLQEDIRVISAGRTDEGVHALGQVVNFHTQSPLATANILRGLNALLPPDIVVKEVEEVDETFHARFSAKSRTYRYVICRRLRAIGRHYSWFVPYALEFDLLQQVAGQVLGEHDFQSFCPPKAEVEHHWCIVYRSEWHQQGDQWVYEIEANRFLHHMVRILVGTMVDIGRGRWRLEDFRRILEARDRSTAGPTAPAKGLFLVKVSY